MFDAGEPENLESCQILFVRSLNKLHLLGLLQSGDEGDDES